MTATIDWGRLAEVKALGEPDVGSMSHFMTVSLEAAWIELEDLRSKFDCAWGGEYEISWIKKKDGSKTPAEDYVLEFASKCAKLKQSQDALIACSRYFDAEDGLNDSNKHCSRKTARYLTKMALVKDELPEFSKT